MRLIRDTTFFAASAGHLAVDLLNSQKDILLAFFSGTMGLTNTLIGLIGTLYTLMASLLQPAFGYLADRFGARWVVTLGIAWMILSFSLAVTLTGALSLVFLVLVALGSAAFHPAGAMEATNRGRIRFSGQETLAASFFFLFGQTGLSLGPAIGGAILDQWGPRSLILLLLIVVPITANAGLRLSPVSHQSHPPIVKERAPGGRRSWGRYMSFGLLTALRSWPQLTLIAFLPKFFSDLGYPPALFGVLAALFMGGSAVGGVIGGWAGDRFNKGNVISYTLFPAVIPLFLLPMLGDTGWAYIITPLAGGLLGASHSVVVVLAQRMMPRNVGAASGLVLGFTFASGSIGALISGIIADAYGFTPVFWGSGVAAALGAIIAFFSVGKDGRG